MNVSNVSKNSHTALSVMQGGQFYIGSVLHSSTLVITSELTQRLVVLAPNNLSYTHTETQKSHVPAVRFRLIDDQAAAVTTKSWPAEYPKWLSYHGHKGKVPTLDLHRHLGSRSKLRCE